MSKEKPIPEIAIKPHVIPRNEHTISRKSINPNALKVLYRLHNAGFGAYLVGGCVRDLLFNHPPKDYDIATDARPEEVRKLFRNCRLIGKRFRLAHIVFGREIIEVATFRTHHEHAEEEHHARMHQGMIVRDNVFGDIGDDAWRRDFTVNALYYNIADFTVVDYLKGMDDIRARMLRVIGQPEKRYHEDPVRLLRAIRFMGKLNLSIHPETEEPIMRLSYLIQNVSSARLFQEVLKFFQESGLFTTFQLLKKYKLLEQLFPQTSESLLHHQEANTLVESALKNTDDRIKIGKTVSPAFLFSVFLWHPIKEQVKIEEQEGFPLYVSYERAIHVVLKKQTVQLAIPRQLQLSIRDICFLQHRFTHRNGQRPYRILEHPRFRAGFDLLFLRAEAGEACKDLYDWWTEFSQVDPSVREKMVKAIMHAPRKRKKRRKVKSS